MSEAIIIRRARPKDSPAIVRLLAELGYPLAAGQVRRKVTALLRSESDQLLVAEQGAVAMGVLHFHLIPLLHKAGNAGRITALVVAEKFRSRGIGKQLVAAAEAWAWSRDCVLIEVTSREQRTQAHKFYHRCGYAVQDKRFVKKKS